MASKSVKLQSPYEGHRVQSLLFSSGHGRRHPTNLRIRRNSRSQHRWKCVLPRFRSLMAQLFNGAVCLVVSVCEVRQL